MGILTENRDELAQYLTSNDIDNNLVHLRNDIYHIFGGTRLDLPMMNSIEPNYLYLPLNTKVTEHDVLFVCDTIRIFFKKV
jgi:dTDP-4-amino-4,6-dideoxygalactose transaminase